MMRCGDLGDCLSSKADLLFGLPQWSVSGPLLFTLYATPLSSMISGHTIPHHLYTDDNQLYVSFASGDSATVLNGLRVCLASVQSWMSMNTLKLNQKRLNSSISRTNDSRASFLVSKLTQQNLFGILGVIFDKNVTFRSLIFAVCSPCFHHIWNLQCIHHYLDSNSAKLPANALVSCHLVYCNSFFSGIVDTDLTKINVFRIDWSVL